MYLDRSKICPACRAAKADLDVLKIYLNVSSYEAEIDTRLQMARQKAAIASFQLVLCSIKENIRTMQTIPEFKDDLSGVKFVLAYSKDKYDQVQTVFFLINTILPIKVK